MTKSNHMDQPTTQKVVLGAGCFWCVDAIFRMIKGVQDISVGYSGGEPQTANYKDVCQGNSGHVEVVRIEFDSDMVSLRDLLRVFFVSHDPTTLNRQGNDVGAQYRSVIFYEDDQQRDIALEVLAEAQTIYEDPIVTAVESLKNYFRAEDYHHAYFEKNPDQGYCRIVIAPKVKKFREKFSHLLQDSGLS